MKNKFIYSPTKSLFEKKLAAGEINEGSIVFIEDTKEIWNRGYYFGMVGSGIDPEVLSGIETAIATLQSDKADKSELANYAKKNELPSLDGYLTKIAADGLYATIAQYNTLNQTVGNIQTELSSKLTSSDLAGYAKTADVPTKISDLTDDSDFITNAEATAAYAPKSLVTTVSDQATTISTLATKSELSTGLAGKLDNSAASGFVPTTRKVNGVALDDDITITATDPNAATKESLNNVNTDLQNFKNSVALTYATDKDVADAIANLVDSSPETLNTLDELAAALGDDPNFATTVSNLIGTKASQDALNETNTNVANLTDILDTKLDKTGGKISGKGLRPLIVETDANAIETQYKTVDGIKIYLGWLETEGMFLQEGVSAHYLGILPNGIPYFHDGTKHTLLHSGNIYEKNLGLNEFSTFRFFTASGDSLAPKNESIISGFTVAIDGNNSFKKQLAFGHDSQPKLYARSQDTGSWSDWKTVAFTDSTVEAAKKLVSNSGEDVLTSNGFHLYPKGGIIMNPNNEGLMIGYTSIDWHNSSNTSSKTIITLNSSGNVTIGASDFARSEWKAFIAGNTFVYSLVDANARPTLGNIPEGVFSIGYHSNGNVLYGLHMWSENSGNGVIQASRADGTAKKFSILLNPLGGKVGIGTDNPAYKLDVNGSFNATSGSINGNAIIHAGNIGSQSVNYANSAGSANSVAWGNVSGKPTFATVATSGSYNDLSNKPTIPSVGNGTVTIKQNGTSKGTFTMNQSGNTTIELADTNTHPDLSSYATQTWVNNKGYITGITKAMVTTALGYTPPSSDTNTWRPIYNGVDSTATDTSASANAVKTAYDKAVSAYNLANGKTSNTGTVTSVATGTGLTGGTITSTGTISINTTYQGYITNGNKAWASHTKLAANKINAIPVTHKVVTCPISAAGSFAISGTMTAGQVIHVIVQNTTTSAKTVTIPNSGSYVSFSGTSLSVPASGYAEINVVYNGEKMFIRTAY